MSNAAMDVLRENLENLQKSVVWLNRSYEACKAIGVLNEYTVDQFDTYENLTSRYSRSTDLIINKVLRSIDTVELLSPGSVIDAANRAEKRGLVDSVNELRGLKDLRNEIAHEYETEDLKELFGAVLESTGKVLEIAGRIAEYCERYE